jgi:phosphoglycolate phosphatase-like HAD superfamily hydrolase
VQHSVSAQRCSREAADVAMTFIEVATATCRFPSALATDRDGRGTTAKGGSKLSARVLALDFDGVISESAPESFWVALKTLSLLRPGEGWDRQLERFGDLDAPESRDSLTCDPLYRDFLRLMPLGNRAEDFGIALLALYEGVRIRDQREWDAYYKIRDPEIADEFHERFYSERRAMRERSPESWGKLMRPYPGLIEVLRRRAPTLIPVIATAKDRESVRFLLRQYGIDGLFPEDRVFDKELGRDKRAHLLAVQERFGPHRCEITFVDDKVNHLESAVSLGVRGVLAAWGYNGIRERELAAVRGYRVCNLDEFEEVLFT